MDKDDKGKKKSRKISYPLLGVSMPLCLLMGYFLGHYLDKFLGTSPMLLLMGICLGIAAGYIQLFKFIKKD